MTRKNIHSKRRFGLMLALAAMVAVFMTPNMLAYAEGDDWAGLQDKFSAGGTITLDQDYKAGDNDTALEVPEGKEVILDLNGHTIDRGLAEAEAEKDGNVITVNANGKLTIKDSSKGKTGTITGGRNNNYGGGVLIYEGASLVMDGGTISGNSANLGGGGVFLEDDAKEFIMNGGTITGNYADSDGGGVAVYYGTFTMNGGTISSNNCKDSGAGVYINDDNAKFIMNKGSIISSNKANNGGGVFVESGSFTMNDGTISENIANYNGGGVFIYFVDCEFSMEGGSITGNKALGIEDKYGNGGGVYSESVIELSDGSISGNTAEESGGGVFADDDISITGGAIDSNTADDDGGGVYVTEKCVFTMTGASSIENNKCDGDGGGVAFYGKTFTMDSGTISGNTADRDGGGVYVSPDSIFTMTGSSSITNNSSDEEGGGVFANGQFVMDGSKATISGNTAGLRGGGISSDNDDASVEYVVIKEGIIKDNTAKCEGGGLYVRNNCTMSGGSSTGNKALGTENGEGGGGVSVSFGRDDVFTMTGGTIRDNTAVNNGGGVNVEASSYLPVSNGTLALSGNPVIENNLITSGKEQNVFLGKEKSVNIAGKLENGASVGVTMETPGIITTGYKDNMAGADPKEFFKTGNDGYGIALSADGEAMLAEAVTYTVTFEDGQGTVLKSEAVEKGESATAPSNPARDKYTFDGWDKDFSNITEDLTVTAKWKQAAGSVSIKNAGVVLSASAFTYNGKAQKPAVKTIGGKALKAGTDYTVSWSNASSKNVGAYTVTITGKGVYAGVTKATYKINPKGTKIKKPKKAKKAIKVKWKRQRKKMSKARITGYQIQLATDSKFTQNVKTVNVKGYKKTSKKVKKLEGGTKYYVKVRTYKTVGGTTCYSGWSKVKKVKTKK